MPYKYESTLNWPKKQSQIYNFFSLIVYNLMRTNCILEDNNNMKLKWELVPCLGWKVIEGGGLGVEVEGVLNIIVYPGTDLVWAELA